MELAGWLGHGPSREALGEQATTPAPPTAAWLLTLCDWDAEALARAALAIGRATIAGPAPGELAQRLRAAQALVDCPCPEHAAGLLEAARRPARAGDPAVRDAVDKACLLAFRAHESRFTQELEPLVGLLLAAAPAVRLDDAALREAVRREVVPWALGRARAVPADA